MALTAIAQPGAGGQAAPANPGKQQSGSAAPAKAGVAAGSPSTPSLEDAIVSEKKKAEHWQKKYERDIAPVMERLAKLEGLAQGFQASTPQPTAPKPPTRAFADLDDSAIDQIVKKGFEDQNPGFITASVREIAERIAEEKAKAFEARSEAHLSKVMAKQQTAAKIVNEFGTDVLNEESDLRQRADMYIAEYMRSDPDGFERNPMSQYLCFKAAKQDLDASKLPELDRLQKAEAEREARAEIERSNQVIATKARADVSDLLAKGDIKGAIKQRLPWAAR